MECVALWSTIHFSACLSPKSFALHHFCLLIHKKFRRACGSKIFHFIKVFNTYLISSTLHRELTIYSNYLPQAPAHLDQPTSQKGTFLAKRNCSEVIISQIITHSVTHVPNRNWESYKHQQGTQIYKYTQVFTTLNTNIHSVTWTFKPAPPCFLRNQSKSVLSSVKRQAIIPGRPSCTFNLDSFGLDSDSFGFLSIQPRIFNFWPKLKSYGSQPAFHQDKTSLTSSLTKVLVHSHIFSSLAPWHSGSLSFPTVLENVAPRPHPAQGCTSGSTHSFNCPVPELVWKPHHTVQILGQSVLNIPLSFPSHCQSPILTVLGFAILRSCQLMNRVSNCLAVDITKATKIELDYTSFTSIHTIPKPNPTDPNCASNLTSASMASILSKDS